MPKGWKETRLGDVAELFYGKGLKENQRRGGKIPVYGSNGIVGYHDEPLVAGPGIIIGRKGNVGAIKFSKINFFPIDTTYYIGFKDDKIGDLTFFYYFLKTLKLNEMNSHSIVPGLNRNDVYLLDILLPPLPEQRAIAEVLSSLDDKIELLREQNKTLEDTAQLIFKEWFVKFNFPGANGKMVNSELGKIPEGWRVGKLGEVIDIFDSKRVPLASSVRAKRKGKFPYYGATSIMDYIDGYLFDGTYLLLAEDGSVINDKGYPVLQYVWDQFWVSNHSHVLQGKSGFSTEILYVFLKKANITGIVNGAVQLKINQTNLVNFEILIPAKDTLRKFDSILQPVFSKIKTIRHQIKTLSTLRDTLLPKLMKGELRVKGFNE